MRNSTIRLKSYKIIGIYILFFFSDWKPQKVLKGVAWLREHEFLQEAPHLLADTRPTPIYI